MAKRYQQLDSGLIVPDWMPDMRPRRRIGSPKNFIFTPGGGCAGSGCHCAGCSISNSPPTNAAIVQIAGVSGNSGSPCYLDGSCINGTWHMFGSGCSFTHYSTGCYHDTCSNLPTTYAPDILAFLSKQNGVWENNVTSLGVVNHDGHYWYQFRDYYSRHKWEKDLGTVSPTTITAPLTLQPVTTGSEWFTTSGSTVTVNQFYNEPSATCTNFTEWQVNSNKLHNCGSPGVEVDAVVNIWATEVSGPQRVLDYNIPPWCFGTHIIRPFCGHEYFGSFADYGETWYNAFSGNQGIYVGIASMTVAVAFGVTITCGSPDTWQGNGYVSPWSKILSSVAALQAGWEYPVWELTYYGAHVANIHCSVGWQDA